VNAPIENPDSGGDRPSGGVGIVLSGGGTRGIAHIGVPCALVEHGIFPDRVAATSAGAIVGALYAAGYTPEEMLEFFVRKNPFRLSKVAISKPGIIDTAKVVADFEEYFPSDSFESLDRELRVVATELTRGEAVTFDAGPLIPALLASSSVPLMFTPMEVGERVYADGGILSNFPVELIEGRCTTLLGVHVSPVGVQSRSDLQSSLSVLQRALLVGMSRASEAKFWRCDVVVTPKELTVFGAFDTKHMQEIEKVGHAAAIESMPSIERAIAAGRSAS
jgi:NTE family protein